MGFKKKLYAFAPKDEPVSIETQRTYREKTVEICDSISVERGVRQLLADKVSGNMTGIWLLIPEFLRLGLWDILCKWIGKNPERIEPRLALQAVNEAALCMTGVRNNYSLSQRGFEIANGLPFVATDWAIHNLFDGKTVEETRALQIMLGKLRKAGGHFPGKTIAIDPHRICSCSKRQMRLRPQQINESPKKTLQTFFAMDADSRQPICFLIASSAMTAAQITPELLDMVQAILNSQENETLVVADKEHFCKSIFERAAKETPFDLLVPMPQKNHVKKSNREMPDDAFKRICAGLATAVAPFKFKGNDNLNLYQIIQRCGEKPDKLIFKNFVSTTCDRETTLICSEFPKRWNVETFFNNKQAYGWNRAGTLNLNIRYANMTMALIAQTAVASCLNKIGEPYINWEAQNLAKNLFCGLDGDIRTKNDAIIVTFYNAPDNKNFRNNFENLPQKLENENIDPRIPWLFNFKLDFKFK